MKRPRAILTRRTLLIGALLLIGGAIVNVAVAWTLVELRTTRASSSVSRRASDVERKFLLHDQSHHAFDCLWPGVIETEFVWPPDLAANLRSAKVSAVQIQSGWPLLCMMTIAVAPNEAEKWHNPSARYDDMRSRLFPLNPIWPGFPINTLLYAAILWMLFAVPFALRRWRRVKRGLCPKCAYDLRGRSGMSISCPECGTSRTVPRLTGAGGVRSTR